MLNPDGLNPEESHSEYFEELCTLAASGQLSEPEFVELQEHAQRCAECRALQADFFDLVRDKLPLAAAVRMDASSPEGASFENAAYRARFLKRARKQGLAMPHTPLPAALEPKPWFWLLSGWRYAHVFALAIVLLLAAVGILGYCLRQSNARATILAANLAAMNRQIQQQDNARIAAPEHPSESPATVPSPQPAPSPVASQEMAKLRQDLADAQANAKALQEQIQATRDVYIKALQEQQGGSSFELKAVSAQLAEAIQSRHQVENKLSESEQGIAQVNRELQRVRDSRSKDAETITAQGRQIQTMSDRLSAQSESLDRETSLLAAGRDIHDLMGARNLHIVDVRDVDPKGRDNRVLGRVFYTEGKSLIFYAYDLGDQGAAKRNASFQVWGSRGPSQNAARSLGMLYVDDQKQNRWVFKFEDPKVLAEIDSVFVTVEPPGGSARPTGQHLLYAYLLGQPNHP